MEQSEVSQEFLSRTRKLIDEVAVPGPENLLQIPEVWDQFSVFVTITPSWSDTFAGQLMLMSSVNLISRFCNNLFIQGSLKETTPRISFPFATKDNLLETCLEIARSTNPLIRTNVVFSKPETSIALGIGVHADVMIASDNWFSYLNYATTPVNPSRSLNPFGPLLASCLGSAEVFRKLLKQLGAKGSISTRVLSDIRFSTLDFSCNDPLAINPAFPQSVDVGKVLFAGSGAVAHGAAAALYFIEDVHGSVVFLDDQMLELSNIGRYFFSTIPDVGQPKAQQLTQVFKNRRLLVEPLPVSVESVTAKDMQKFDVVFSTLDNRNNHSGRIHLQNLLPRKIIHAATQGLAVALASIDFLEGACLGCLFSPRGKEVKMVPDSVCGGVTIQIENDKDFAAAVSFVSAASGILAASEHVKSTVPELRPFALRNYLSMSLMSPDLTDIHFRHKDPSCLCLCTEQFRQGVYKSKYSTRSRHHQVKTTEARKTNI